MAIVFQNVVRCGCGEQISAPLADGVNIGRTPAVRDQILAGTFHTVRCPKCRRVSTVEKSFLYTDLARNTVIQVKPRQDRHRWRDVGAAFRKNVARLPRDISPEETRHARVVFGMAELREKLLAQDLAIDDQFLEVLKVKAIHTHPFLLDHPRLRLIFEGAGDDGLRFLATYDLSLKVYRVTLTRADAQRMYAAQSEVPPPWPRHGPRTPTAWRKDTGSTCGATPPSPTRSAISRRRPQSCGAKAASSST